ncbi:MAG: hypothetical protein TR69_WS6001001354 [candidate division WS6 bacterium OLB20]|uniref:Uncharacterized protein n=1 Tax=candidate division WS6 bacterium OLB20 TaxID=1617426 RepID=A0A136LWM3_9BACT|nr:MAG: hypothetical protein TR69_WS6001001354 [candidate division WS6 bacterium OLB20]
MLLKAPLRGAFFSFTIHRIMIETSTETFVPLAKLLKEFASDVEAAADNPQPTYDAIQKINPLFVPDTYSDDNQANLLANVVAGIYAPVIHGFTAHVLDNIAAGILPDEVLLPPRDTIPMVYSLYRQSQLRGIPVTIHTPAVNRITAGIANNQADYNPVQDPLFDELLVQHFGQLEKPLLELETGIYGTTTLALAEGLHRNGIRQPVIPYKLYGLGPNLSFIHGALSSGAVFKADCAQDHLNSAVLKRMVFVDSIEEYGMQNRYYSVPALYRSPDGSVQPVIEEQNGLAAEIAAATNSAVALTADLYQDGMAIRTAAHILISFQHAVTAARAGMPLCLRAAVPPMDNKAEHYAKLEHAISAGLILQPDLIY